MSAHTPGPWRIVDNTDLDGGLWIVVDHDEVGPVSIAVVRPGCDEARELGSNKANAHLIASAPKLLEALQGCISYQNWAIAEGGVVPDALRDTWRRAEAALSKARPVLTGGTSE